MAGDASSAISSWAGGGAQTTLGAIESYYAYQGLQDLEKQPNPEYNVSKGLTDYYNTTKERSAYGFDPAETAAFRQNVAQQQNTGYRQGVALGGGNLARSLSLGLGADRLNSFNQFAAQDAQQKRANISEWGNAAGQVQNQENLINQDKIRRRIQLETAYGSALQTGLGNISNGLNSGAGATSATTWGSSQQAQLPAGGNTASTPQQYTMSEGSGYGGSSTPSYNPGGSEYGGFGGGNNPSENWGGLY